MFKEENVELYNELQGLSEEVEAIGKNVECRGHSYLTGYVHRKGCAIGSTENVKDANEQIKQAIQRSAGLRVWSLFFLLVMSLSLLFLDWYYD